MYIWSLPLDYKVRSTFVASYNCVEDTTNTTIYIYAVSCELMNRFGHINLCQNLQSVSIR